MPSEEEEKSANQDRKMFSSIAEEPLMIAFREVSASEVFSH